MTENRKPLTFWVLDTETTGFSPKDHRVLEIGMVEVDRQANPTGREFHQYIDPEQEVDPNAARVHGMTRADLAGYPTWAQVAPILAKLLEGAVVIAHNASFDLNHLRAQSERLEEAGHPSIAVWHDHFCTKNAAKERLGSQVENHKLDTVADYYGVDRSAREEVHGALVDARLLAEVLGHLKREREALHEPTGVTP